MSDKDPVPHARTYYRRGEGDNGQRAYLVERSGVKMLKLDSFDPEVVVKYDPSIWFIERESRPLTEIQAAKVAYALDEALCEALHVVSRKRLKWLDMQPDDRVDFMRMGPTGHPMRKELFRLVMGKLAEISAG